MIPALLAALAIGGILVVAFWDDIVNWLKKLAREIKAMFSRISKKIAHAVAGFIQRVENGLAAIRHKLYYKEQGQWVEETTTRKIKESEVPPRIRNLISSQEEDITEELEDELQLSLN